MERKSFLNANIVWISLSAFFADTGYQIILAGLPLFLVLKLGYSTAIYGLTIAIMYGGGSLFGLAGGILSDKFGRKRTAIIGNSFIPLLSFIGVVGEFFGGLGAIILASLGWWSRDFRTPARRALLKEFTSKRYASKSFGFLHALDIGGALTAAALLIIFLYLGFDFNVIFLFTIIPLAISTLCLVLVNTKNNKVTKVRESKTDKKISSDAYRGLLIATALYGFAYYSLGFPVLTVAQKSNSILGVLTYLIIMGVSAVTGYVIGSKNINVIKGISVLGYLLAGIGSILFGYAYALQSGIFLLYIGAVIIGFAFGTIETLEPTLVSLVSSNKKLGTKMGGLTSSRGAGLFIGNLMMGVLYVFSPIYSYTYAAVVAIIAAVVVYFFGKGLLNR